MPAERGQQLVQQRRPIGWRAQHLAPAAAPRPARRATGPDRAATRARQPPGPARGRYRATARSSARTSPRSRPSPCSHATRSSRAAIAARSVSGEDRSSASWRAPAPVTQRSTAAIRLTRRGRPARLEHFEAGAGCLVHRQQLAAAARDRRQQQRQAPAPGMVEIADEAARRREHRPAEAAEPVERGDPVHRLQPRFARIAAEFARRPGDRTLGRALPLLGRDQFACAQPRQRRRELPARRTPPAPSARSRCRTPRCRWRRAPRTPRRAIGAPRLEQRFLGQRARGDETDDVARDQRFRPAALLCLRGALDLFGDGDPAAGA